MKTIFHILFVVMSISIVGCGLLGSSQKNSGTSNETRQLQNSEKDATPEIKMNAGMAGGNQTGTLLILTPTLELITGTVFLLPPAFTPGVTIEVLDNQAIKISYLNDSVSIISPLANKAGFYIIEHNNQKKKLRKNNDGSYTVIENY